MKKFATIFMISIFAISLANAETRTMESPLETIEMPASLAPKASVEPLNGELYLEVLNHIHEYAEYLNSQGADISLTRINQWMAMNKNYFTNGQLVSISEKLKTLDEENYQAFMLLEYKDPTVSLILSILTGCLGVDRFYIGDIGLGIGKLLTAGGLGVWWLVDLFCIQNATKRANYNDVNSFLAMIM